jgi:peroxiredoxin
MSAQTNEDQIEAATRLHLPYELVSDSQLQFAKELGLPIFEVAEKRLLRRVTLVIKDGIVMKYFYPVFPPERNADDVFSWCEKNAT